MKDRFSHTADGYAAFRPLYPWALYDYIFSKVVRFDLAWDAGTGNGQAARVLAARFRKVYATDISATQLEKAERMSNIQYRIASETTDLEKGSVDLITVAQAIHWFDRPAFYDEVRRVASPEAMLAVWGYGLAQWGNPIDEHLKHFYREVVGPYWDPERQHIDERYAGIDFPFKEVQAPAFQIDLDWTADTMDGYLRTWSAVRNFRAAKGFDPVEEFVKTIRPLWGGARKGRMEIFMRLGKVS